MFGRIKTLFHALFNNFIFGGHLLSIGAACIVYSACLALQYPISATLLIASYCGTESIYLFNRIKEIEHDKKDNPERTQVIVSQKKLFSSLAVGLFIFLLTMLLQQQKASTTIFALSLLGLGLLYSISLKKVTKVIPLFKDFIAAFFWGGLIFFAAIYSDAKIDGAVTVLFLFTFLRLLLSISYFDIKDIRSDQEAGLKTTAVVLGEKKLLLYLKYMNIVSILPIFIGVYLKYLPTYSLALCLIAIYSFYYLSPRLTHGIKRHTLYNIIVDGEFVFWPILILFGIWIF